jgi:hypothetical protein
VKHFAILILLLATTLATAPPLHLEATTTRSEFLAGDQFTVDAYLFNDGATPQLASLAIQAPPGFDLIRVAPPITQTATIAPGRALRESWTYRVKATPGLYYFAVLAFDDKAIWTGLAAPVTIRVGPVKAPPAQYRPHRVYFPAFY